MNAYQTPEQVMKDVTRDMIRRSIRRSRRKGRRVYISKTAKGKAVDVETLNPDTPEGSKNLENFLTPAGRHYTF